MKSRKWLSAILSAALAVSIASTALATSHSVTSHNETVPGSVYGLRKAITKVAEQAKQTIEEQLKKQNPGLSSEEVKKQVEEKAQEEIKVVTQQKLEKTGVKDVKADHWAGTQIAVLVEAGFIKPDATGNVKPDAGTTINETAALFAKVLGVANETDTTEEAAAKAEQSGIVRNRTAFDRDMTRIEVAYMLVTALGLELKEVKVSDVPFRDFFLMSEQDWAVVTALFDNGIFKGYEDRTFRPNNVLTKAQIALLVDRVLGALEQ